MRRAEIPIDQKYLQGNGLDVGAGWNPLEETLSIDTAVRGEPYIPGAEPSKAVWRADAADLPLKDEVCDYIFCSHFLEHVEDRLPEVLAEFKRVLKPGGFLVAIMPDIAYCRKEDDHFCFDVAPDLEFDAPHGLSPVRFANLDGFEVVQIDTQHNNFTFDLVARRI